MTNAVISEAPFAGIAPGDATRVMADPDGATKGARSQDPASSPLSISPPARVALEAREARPWASIRADKDSTFMDLAGQGTRPTPSAQSLDDGGYIMVVLLIGIAVSAVWMGAMLPAWRQQAVRQKEAELIFRGEEYARAIALYWRKNNQTLPTNFDALVSQRFLRKKYLDPMTDKEFLAVGGVGPGSTMPPVGRGVGGGSGPS